MRLQLACGSSPLQCGLLPRICDASSSYSEPVEVGLIVLFGSIVVGRESIGVFVSQLYHDAVALISFGQQRNIFRKLFQTSFTVFRDLQLLHITIKHRQLFTISSMIIPFNHQTPYHFPAGMIVHSTSSTPSHSLMRLSLLVTPSFERLYTS
ncbi:hypothetical protein CPC08DRAFT_749515, partial [Agrocybe pediades]